MIEFIKNIWLRTIFKLILLVPLFWIIYTAIIVPNAWNFIFSHAYQMIVIPLGIFLWLDLVFNIIKNKYWYLTISIIGLLFFVYTIIATIYLSLNGNLWAEGIAIVFAILFFLLSVLYSLFYFFRFKWINKKKIK